MILFFGLTLTPARLLSLCNAVLGTQYINLGEMNLIPVIALASMNRTSYSDVINMVLIKESGAIEYTSDVCIGLQIAAMDSIVEGAKDNQGEQEKKEFSDGWKPSNVLFIE